MTHTPTRLRFALLGMPNRCFSEGSVNVSTTDEFSLHLTVDRFTTVRDTGGANAALKNAIDEGLVAGPRLFISGKALSQTGGHGDLRQPHQNDSFKCCSGHGPGLARICDGVPACLEAARDELRRGADNQKIMVGGGVASPVDPLEMIQFTAEEIKAITQSANNLGTYVTAHAYTNEAIRHAVDNGVMCIEHGNFIDPETAKYCAERGIIFVPTLVTYKQLITPPYDKFLPENGRVNAQRVIDSGGGALKILQEAGVVMCYGTDLLAGMHMHQHGEWEIRAEGLSNVEILKAATINAAKLLKMEGKICVLAEGAFADFLILDGNPLNDLSIFKDMQTRCLGIVKEGRIVMSQLEDEGLKVNGIYR